MPCSSVYRGALPSNWDGDEESPDNAEQPHHLTGGVCWEVGRYRECHRKLPPCSISNVGFRVSAHSDIRNTTSEIESGKGENVR